MDVISSTLKMEVHVSPKWAMSTFKLSRCQETEKCRLPPQISFLPRDFIFLYSSSFLSSNCRNLAWNYTTPTFFLGPYAIYYLLITQIIRSCAIWIPDIAVNWTTHRRIKFPLGIQRKLVWVFRTFRKCHFPHPLDLCFIQGFLKVSVSRIRTPQNGRPWAVVNIMP